MIDGTALRTESALLQLFSLPVRIEDVILLGVSGDATGGRAPSRRQVCLLHVELRSEIDADRSRPVLTEIFALREVRRRKPVESRRRSRDG
jgi:hypothetical protein